jgi:hypothetical protein
MKYLLQLHSLLTLLTAVLGCAGSIRANTIFTDLNSPYSTASSFIVGGPQSAGFDAQAMQFTAAQTGVLADAQLFMGLVAGNNSPMIVALESNNNGLPGSILTTLTQQGTVPLFASAGLVTFSCGGACPVLTAGTQYWLAASATGNSVDYWGQLLILPNTVLGSEAISFTSLTGPWNGPNAAALGAFQVDGTPEPAAWTTVALGILVMAQRLERKKRE